MSSITKAFNNHLVEFMDDVITIFPDDVDILSAQTAILALKKINPKAVVTIWRKYIAEPYGKQILDNDIEFFLTKDYSKDLEINSSSQKILRDIERLRNPIRNMGDANKQKSMKYLQNLTKLSQLA